MEKHPPVLIYLIGFMLIAFGLKLAGYINIQSIEILGFMMIIFGISYVFISFGQNKKGVLFTSTTIFLLGVLIILAYSLEFFNTSVLIYPAFFFIIGISFFMLFMEGNTGVKYLAVFLFFIILGGIITALKGDFKGSSFFASFIDVVEVYWPIVLIVVIVYFLILKGERKNYKNL